MLPLETPYPVVLLLLQNATLGRATGMFLVLPLLFGYGKPVADIPIFAEWYSHKCTVCHTLFTHGPSAEVPPFERVLVICSRRYCANELSRGY
jgi:hypothetical protein